MDKPEGLTIANVDQYYSKLSKFSRNAYITEVEGFQHNESLQDNQANLWIDGRSVPEYLSSQYPIGGRPMEISLHPIDDETELYRGNMALSIIGEKPEDIVNELMPEIENYEDWKHAKNQAKEFGPKIENTDDVDIFLEAGTLTAGSLVGEDILVHTHIQEPEENLYDITNNWNGKVHNSRLNT